MKPGRTHARAEAISPFRSHEESVHVLVRRNANRAYLKHHTDKEVSRRFTWCGHHGSVSNMMSNKTSTGHCDPRSRFSQKSRSEQEGEQSSRWVSFLLPLVALQNTLSRAWASPVVRHSRNCHFVHRTCHAILVHGIALVCAREDIVVPCLDLPLLFQDRRVDVKGLRPSRLQQES